MDKLRREAFGKSKKYNDNAQETTSDSASATDNVEEDGTGTYLKYFRGQYLSERAIDIIKSDEVSRRESRKHAHSKRFRSKIGFKNTL